MTTAPKYPIPPMHTAPGSRGLSRPGLRPPGLCRDGRLARHSAARQSPQLPSHRTFHPGSAFTLVEVLIAMGIFAVGFVAVAAIFPTAVLLQKKTVDDVVAQQVARNAQALIEAKGLLLDVASPPPPPAPPLPPASLEYLRGQMIQGGFSSWETDQLVYPLPLPMLTKTHDYGTAPKQRWLLSDRSYPSSTNPPDQRKVFWVPFVRDEKKDPADTTVMVYVFILQRAAEANYPRPGAPADWANYYDGTNVPGIAKQPVTVSTTDPSIFDFGTGGNVWGTGLKVNVGDKILDCYGNIYTVTAAGSNGVTVSSIINSNPDDGKPPKEIWYAAPDATGKQRPVRDILTLSGVVK